MPTDDEIISLAEAVSKNCDVSSSGYVCHAIVSLKEL